MTCDMWRPVVGFEGRYEVSDQGLVRSLMNANGRRRLAPLVLKYGYTRGYPQVRLRGADRLVHRVVLEAFIGPCPPNREGAHLNGVQTDNWVENLAWVTHSENMLHRRLHGTSPSGDRNGSRLHPETRPRGEKVHTAKLTPTQVIDIRAAAACGETHVSQAARYGVGKTTIRHVVHRRTWAHISGEKQRQ